MLRGFAQGLATRRRPLAFVAVLACVAALLAATTSSAQADHRWWGTWPIEPDRGVHTFCFDPNFPSSTTIKARARYSMDNNDGVEAQTIVSTNEVACTTNTDVLLQERAADPGAGGDTWCKWQNVDTGRCDQWRVRIAWAFIQSTPLVSDAPREARHTLCHEIGHTLGLHHWGQGDPYYGSPQADGGGTCMRSGVWDGGQAWTRSYGAHDQTAINDNW